MNRNGIIIICICTVAAAIAVGGCGKSEPSKPTAQEITAFKGHQPTPEQLKAAMSRVSQGRPPAPPSGAPK